MFESVEEVDQIETEPKSEEAKQVPKMPNGALQNGTSSPDSGHPSSRNFSITSGLSDGSFSTEDSAAAAAPQASQSSDKPTGGQSEGLTEMDSKVKGVVKDKEEAEEGEKAPDVTETTENTEVMDKKVETKTGLQAEAQKENLKAVKAEEEEESTFTVTTAATQSKGEVSKQKEGSEKVSQLGVTEVEKEIKGSEESKDAENIFRGPGARAVEQNVGPSDARVSGTREALCAPQKDETQVMTESDESPSAIEMEEIPKAKVSMVPWSRKGHCESSSSSEDLCTQVKLRQEDEEEEEQGKLSPEGTESILSEEPEMESLYPPFNSLTASEDTKTEETSQESAGSAFSVCTSFLYI